MPPRSDDRVGGRRLDRRPLRELLRLLAEREHREVRRGTVGIHVREPARDDGRPRARGFGSIERGSRYRVVQRIEPVPGARGLERLADHAERDDRVAGVRRADERVAPAPGRALARLRSPPCRRAPRSPRRRPGRRDRGRTRPRVRSTASSGWSADSNAMSRSVSPCVVGAGQSGLERVEQPAVGGVQTRLRDRARGIDSRRRTTRSAPLPTRGTSAGPAGASTPR